MTFPAISPRPRASWRLAATAALWVSLAIGCASPGPPRPPSLHLPEPVGNLSAQRIGGAVELHWTTPLRTTDGLAVTGPLTAELCRSVPSATAVRPASAAARCAVVQRIAVAPGASHATDTLPPSLVQDPAALLAYRIQIFNSHGHSAGLSAEVFAASGAAPPPLEQLHATLTRSGTRLEWQPVSEAFPIELDRIAAPSSALPAAKSAAKPTAKPAAKLFSLTAVSQPAEVHLTVANRPADLGGAVDGTALPTTDRGQTYRYTAQRVRTVQIAGHALELRSLSSPAVLVSMHDIFPPATPTGLAAIPGGTGESGLSIDLSWQPVPDTDVAGYAVYRRQVSSGGALLGQPQRLTATPVAGPAFRDRTALPGHRYAYTVTAIDTAGNESAPSAGIQETAREP